MDEIRSRIAPALIVFLVFCAGMYLVPLRMMHLDLSFIPGDLGDARLNNYFLEHGYQWLTGKVNSFWNAPFFYPAVRTITYSDNHLGTLPIYALFRLLHFDRETAYQLWFLALFALNYFSCAWVLKKFSLNTLAVAAGAFVFTFSLPVIARLGHSQLLPRFMIPLGFYYAFRYLERPAAKTLAFTCLAVVFQFYCTIYMGYFLVLGLLSLAAAFLILQNNRRAYFRETVGPSSKTLVARTGILAASVVSLLPLMVPYFETSLEYGLRSWTVITETMPRLSSYLYPAGGSILWSRLDMLGASLSLPWEHQIFVGMLPLTAFLIMPAIYLRSGADPSVKRGMIAFLAIAILFIMTLYIPHTPYRFISSHVPGLRSVKAVTRIVLMMLFPLSLILGVVLTKLSEKGGGFTKRPATLILSFIIMAAIVLDQGVGASGLYVYSKPEAQRRSERVEKLVQDRNVNAAVFAYMPAKGSDTTYAVHIDAMMAAQKLGMATVNGYSGSLPYNFEFYDKYDSCGSLMKWIALSSEKYGGYYEGPGLFKSQLIVGRDSCDDHDARFSFMDRALADKDYQAIIAPSATTVSVPPGETFSLSLQIKNAGAEIWRSLTREGDGKYKIQLSYRWLSSKRSPLGGFDPRFALPHDLGPGESVSVALQITPPATPGIYCLEFDLVQEHVAWFHDKGSPSICVEVEVI